MTDIQKTLAERGERYGEFREHARVTQNIKAAMRDSINWSAMRVSNQEALEMIAHKIGRILNGSPTYIDSWHDIIGYATLVEQEIIKEQSDVSKEKEPRRAAAGDEKVSREA